MAKSLAAEDVTQIAAALHGLLAPANNPTPAVQAVTLKLPSFWCSKPEVWFTQIESQFAIRHITNDQTRYDYVVSALDDSTASEIEALLLSPPAENRYDAVKQTLISAFGKSQAVKDSELLAISGLGDKKPTGLLRYMRSLNADPETLMRALFLQQLPPEVRRVLAGSTTTDLDELAVAADRIVESSTNDPFSRISSISRTSENITSTRLCFYHKKFGNAAKKCARKDCELSHLVPVQLMSSSQESSSSGNGKAGH